MRAIRIATLDPAYNLALEETLFQSLQPGCPGWFLIWRNGPSIIIGRHQNTLEEINADFVREKGLSVVRRPSGGGAVYHDEGNVNFSFLTAAEKNEDTGFARFLAPIVGALADLGVKAEFSSRNDITVQGRKISGSAQRRSGHRMLHHGTMMVDLDATALGLALAGNPDKYQSRGVASHQARVANLREFLPSAWSGEECMERVIRAMIHRCADGETALAAEQERAANALADARYRTWDWNYGKSPEFTERRRKRFPFGAVECRFRITDGIIRSCRLFGDFFSAADIAELEALFTGLPSSPQALYAALRDAPLEQWFLGGERDALLAFFCENKT
jgi:lipoate-protein ligase A